MHVYMYVGTVGTPKGRNGPLLQLRENIVRAPAKPGI